MRTDASALRCSVYRAFVCSTFTAWGWASVSLRESIINKTGARKANWDVALTEDGAAASHVTVARANYMTQSSRLRVARIASG